MTLCIVGVGEPMGGDDGVGIAVVERLRVLGTPAGTELHALRDPSELATVLAGAERALIVDAVLDPERVGSVRLLDGAGFAAQRRPLSTHGVDVMTAVELGRQLAAADFPSVSFLAIGIGLPDSLTPALSSPVAAAVEGAVELALSWAKETAHA